MSERLEDYDYDLPEELIAQTPLADRSASRLLWLHLDSGQITHQEFSDVPSILAPGDLLIVNDTRVTAVRLFGQRDGGGRTEVLVLGLDSQGRGQALVKPAARLKPGKCVRFEEFWAEVVGEGEGGMRTLQMHGNWADGVRQAGQTPLPPYIHEKLDDPERYQTVFAREPGSAAAPTAGLHFTPELLGVLAAKGVGVASVTLNVGLDTFRPVTVESIEEHVMHGEECVMPRATAEAIKSCRGRIVAVGTTAARTLESFATGPRRVDSGAMRTSLFIRPGYRFQVVEGMFTNFHLPRTTMLMMISALAGRERILDAYKAAVDQHYRFLSFGDSMLLL